MAEKQFQQREIIFHEGDTADHAFVIRGGGVEIFKHGTSGDILLASLKPGDVFGEMALFEQNGTRSATARSTADTVVDILNREEFEQLLGQCPPRILPLIQTVLERLRSSNKRLSEKEAASVILDSEIDRIIIKHEPGAVEFPQVETLVARLPFRIGGFEADKPSTRNRHNHLHFACNDTPLLVSKQHCQIEIIDGGLYLTDLGSRFTTIVNSRQIGRGKGVYNAPLQKGENRITLGGAESPYKILMICE